MTTNHLTGVSIDVCGKLLPRRDDPLDRQQERVIDQRDTDRSRLSHAIQPAEVSQRIAPIPTRRLREVYRSSDCVSRLGCGQARRHRRRVVIERRYHLGSRRREGHEALIAPLRQSASRRQNDFVLRSRRRETRRAMARRHCISGNAPAQEGLGHELTTFSS